MKNSAPGPDKIPMKILKNNANILSPVLSHLCNLSLNTGTFPNIHKIGNIIPLHKGKDKDDIANYRPVCLLNSVSKLLEKIICNRLTKHLKNKNIINRNQYAYCKGKGTDIAITKYVKDVLDNFDVNKLTLSVFLAASSRAA